MKIIDQSYEIINHPIPDYRMGVLQLIEKVGRVCYKSEDHITENSCIRFVESIKNREHWAVLEHFNFTICMPEWMFVQFENLRKQYADDPVVINCFKFIYLNEINEERDKDKKFIISISATTINYLWNHLPHKIIDTAILNVFTFVARQYPELIKVPSEITKMMNLDNIVLDNRIQFAKVDEINDKLKLMHKFVTVKFITSRSIANQIVRHRIASFAQESMRYNNYTKDKFDNEITIIKNNHFFKDGVSQEALGEWTITNEYVETAYEELIKLKIPPEIARDILPHDTKTELMMTANLYEWRHFLKLRTDHHSHPQIRELTIPLLDEFIKLFPNIFDDLKGDK